MSERRSGAGNRHYWDQQTERGTPSMLTLLVKLASWFGRPALRWILWPVAAYFWLTAGAARRSSRDFLARVYGREGRGWLSSWIAPLRHFHAFATVSVDRVYLLGGRETVLEVTTHVPDTVLDILAAGRGCILIVAHFGSFEVLRVRGAERNEAPIRIVLDRGAGRMAMRLFERLNPRLAAGVIDAAQRGPELMLSIKAALEEGGIVGIMADRVRKDERCVTARFLGGNVRLPAGPWMIAGLLDAPVVLGFGVYRGGRRYDCYLEPFIEHIGLSRESRQEKVQALAQRYAHRLEEYVRAAPYNWFNFYDYWHDASAKH